MMKLPIQTLADWRYEMREKKNGTKDYKMEYAAQALAEFL